jgi:hypothetical protein
VSRFSSELGAGTLGVCRAHVRAAQLREEEQRTRGLLRDCGKGGSCVQ